MRDRKERDPVAPRDPVSAPHWQRIHKATPSPTAPAACWRTPPEVFEPLKAEFGFTLDAAALAASALCPAWFGPDHPEEGRRDALRDGVSWQEGGPVWLNPPYGPGMGLWLRRVVEEAQRPRAEPVVVLSFNRSDTAWFQDYVMKYAFEVRLLRGRITFLEAATGEPRRGRPKVSKRTGEPLKAPILPSPVPSVVSVFWRHGKGGPSFTSWDPGLSCSGD